MVSMAKRIVFYISRESNIHPENGASGGALNIGLNKEVLYTSNHLHCELHDCSHSRIEQFFFKEDEQD